MVRNPPSGRDRQVHSVPPSKNVTGGSADLRPELIENFVNRSGYLKPAEGANWIPMLGALLREDLTGVLG